MRITLGDKFGKLFNSYWSSLVNRLISRGVPPADAPDYVQGAYLKVARAIWGNPGLIDDEARLREYVFQAAWRLYLDDIKKHKRIVLSCDVSRDDDGEYSTEQNLKDPTPSVLDQLIQAENRVASRLPYPHIRAAFLNQVRRAADIVSFWERFERVATRRTQSADDRFEDFIAYVYHLTDSRPEITRSMLALVTAPDADEDERRSKRKCHDDICRKVKKILDAVFNKKIGRVPAAGRKEYARQNKEPCPDAGRTAEDSEISAA